MISQIQIYHILFTNSSHHLFQHEYLFILNQFNYFMAKILFLNPSKQYLYYQLVHLIVDIVYFNV